MYSTGLTTAFLYIASVISFLLGAQYPEYYKIAMGLCIAFFVIATITLLVMMRKRMDRQDF